MIQFTGYSLKFVAGCVTYGSTMKPVQLICTAQSSNPKHQGYEEYFFLANNVHVFACIFVVSKKVVLFTNNTIKDGGVYILEVTAEFMFIT